MEHGSLVSRPVLIMMLGLAASLTLSPVERGWAQEEQVEIIAPRPEPVRPPELVVPGQSPQLTHPREADFRPDNIRTRHDPAFITPFTTTRRTGPTTAVRIGLSGWTAPPGRGDRLVARETSGWFALGVTIVWGVPVPMEPGTPQASPAASTRRLAEPPASQ